MSRAVSCLYGPALLAVLLVGTTALIPPSFPRQSKSIRPPSIVNDEHRHQPPGKPPSSLAKTIKFQKTGAPPQKRNADPILGLARRPNEEYQKRQPSSSSSLTKKKDPLVQKDEDDSFLLGNGVTLSKSDAGTLIVDLPPARTADKASLLGAGAFSVAWFSAIVPATLASGGGAGLFFMLPFWAAGGLMAKNVVVDPFVTTQLKLGAYAWSMTSVYGPAGNKVLRQQEGATAEIRGARVEETRVRDEERNETRIHHNLKLYISKNKAIEIPTPPDSTEQELEYLADRINQHLKDTTQETTDPDGTLFLGGSR